MDKNVLWVLLILAEYINNYVRTAQCKNWDNSRIFLRNVGISTLSADSRIVSDNSRIAQGILPYNRQI